MEQGNAVLDSVPRRGRTDKRRSSRLGGEHRPGSLGSPRIWKQDESEQLKHRL